MKLNEMHAQTRRNARPVRRAPRCSCIRHYFHPPRSNHGRRPRLLERADLLDTAVVPGTCHAVAGSGGEL